MTKIPETTYLQWFDEDEEESEDQTWCTDKIYDTDIQYVRADKYDELYTASRELLELIEEHGNLVMLAHAKQLLHIKNVIDDGEI